MQLSRVIYEFNFTSDWSAWALTWTYQGICFPLTWSFGLTVPSDIFLRYMSTAQDLISLSLSVCRIIGLCRINQQKIRVLMRLCRCAGRPVSAHFANAQKHKTCLYNFDPLKPHFYIVKLGFTGVYIIFLISAQKHRLWVTVRTASERRF